MQVRIILLIPILFLSVYAVSQQAEKKQRDTAFYSRSQKFYDSVYHKFSRHHFTRLLYNLAFVEPRVSDFPDSLQVEKTEIAFSKFSGKIIRKIAIKTLNPFGASIYDTSSAAITSIGKALNAVHINTRKHVIRKNLLLHPGDAIKPEILADNERILRDLISIDNARIIVTPCGTESDSVDLLIVVKDVWSIGFDIPTITTNKVLFRLYDANFLGMNDYLGTKLSIKTGRSPFFRFDGGNYYYTNINGSFIDASLDFSTSDNGNLDLTFSLYRSFLTNYTKWAGALSLRFLKNSTWINDTLEATTYFYDQNIWNGWSLTPVKPPDFTRLIISAAAYRRHFTSRPLITIDSNRMFYNQLHLLASLSISKNQYYLTDYLSSFGKTENLPYGYLFQLTIGKEYTDFYQRFYSGFTISAGDFFNKIGYFQASLKFGSYLYQGGFEDGILKLSTLYFTPLKTFGHSRYRLRTFFTTEYRYGFNFRSNNRDYYNINDKLKIDRYKDSDIFKGTQVISARLSMVIYTPWYLYGFRFALYEQIQGGMCSVIHQPLWTSQFISGFGAGVVIKNDNLVFPNFMIGGYFYPNTFGGISMFQGVLSSDIGDNLSDFNVSAPHVEILGN
jgi:hypothetical protein